MRSHRWYLLVPFALALMLVGMQAPQPAHAQTYFLDYTAIAGTCSAAGFSVTTTGQYDLATDVTIQGSTTLDGVPYDTYSFSLPAGSATFSTGFSRMFSPALPDNSYVFEFRSRLYADGKLVYTTVITFNCTEGGLTASVRGIEPGQDSAPIALEPGCDALLPIPETAVGGTFVANAEVYWRPGELANPPVTIPAGMSARVVGTDSTGQYYQIIWSCEFLWVKLDTIGPNPDAVWQGQALPSGVVSGGS